MNGRLHQDSRNVEYQNVGLIRGVIAGEVAKDSGIAPGDASLELAHRTFAGSVIEINDDEVVFSTTQMSEIAPLLGAIAETTIADGSTIERQGTSEAAPGGAEREVRRY